MRNHKPKAGSCMHGNRKYCVRARCDTRKINVVLYDATENPKDIQRALVFVFKTCCFSGRITGLSEEFACGEPNRNVKLLIVAPVASGSIYIVKLL